ncbi:MAG: hypothetical protein HYZ42_10920, partial [Bacteroidetes bacterium]|nr:hypothetical protein [Bacteroidota bacterium]
MKHLIKTLLFSILLLLNLAAKAQTKPVQVSTFLTPPVPGYLSEYTTGSSDKVQVQVLLIDIGTERDVYMKLNISGPGLSGSTNVSFKPSYHLIGGSALTLGMSDLAGYFELNHLDGITGVQYAAALAEGAYFICFEIYDQKTDALISNSGCVSTLLTQNDPPFLSMPQSKEKLIENPSISNNGLQFQWTPRHVSMGTYYYKFNLAKVTGNSYSPENYLMTFGPDYAVNDLVSPSHLVSVNDYPLVPGNTYVWQVQVYAMNGADTVHNFKNDGKSEIWWFTYDTASCNTPTAPIAVDVFKTSIKLLTNGATQIRYKPNDAAMWYEAPAAATDTFLLLTNLKSNTTYEIKAGAACQVSGGSGNEGYVYSSSITATTLSDTSTVHKLTCQIETDATITNQTRKTNLAVGQYFEAGKF